MKTCIFLGLWLLFANSSIADLEQLLGVSVDHNGITFQVKSNGCTKRDDFDVSVKEVLIELSPMIPAFAPHHYISVERRQKDECESYIRYGTTIFYSFDELNIIFGEFHINNPIGGDR